MALTSCPDCGREMSEDAKQCPQCGYAPAKRPPRTVVVSRIVLGCLLFGVAAWGALKFIPSHDPVEYGRELIRGTDASVGGLAKLLIQVAADDADGRWFLTQRGMDFAWFAAGVVGLFGMYLVSTCRQRVRDLVDCDICERPRVAQITATAYRCETCHRTNNARTRSRRVALLATFVPLLLIFGVGPLLLGNADENGVPHRRRRAGGPADAGTKHRRFNPTARSIEIAARRYLACSGFRFLHPA